MSSGDRRGRRRWGRWALVTAAAVAAVPLGAGAGMGSLSSGTSWWDVGRATGAALPRDVDFDGLAIDEPLPDDVVKAGFAPDPEFFSDEEIADGLGGTGIPEVALAAYEDGAELTAVEDPECGVPWSVLAAIGRVESDHGRFGGAMLRPDGYGTRPIRGIALDGRPGIALIRDTDRGGLDGDTVFDRAVGPMQFIPSTWANVGVDGNGDDRRDPNNIFDAAWGAGVYLCAGEVDLTEPGQLARAVRRYNHTDEYVRVVLGLAEAYENGDYEAAPGADGATLGETGMDPGVFRDFEDVDPAPGGSGFDDNGLAPAPRPAPAPAPAPGPAPDPAPAPAPNPAPAPAPAPAP
ncbi:MAG TPA: lytic transglycosylase domain-containing protein, partial [Acidimicrobiales bacterium]|nr:lytic transglycosylase domain-containing protein [Acidimicrobiales bacterium]